LTSELSIPLGSKLSFRETNEFIESVTKGLKTHPQKIVIDMTTCIYLNSIMLSGLIRAHKICQEHSLGLVLKNVSASTLTLFDTTNVTNLFTIDNKAHSGSTSELVIQWSSSENNALLCHLIGSLASPVTCNQFRLAYEQKIGFYKNFILDFSKLDHLGSPGITECLRLRGLVQEKNGQLLVVGGSESLDALWRMMHLGSLIPKFETLHSALLNGPLLA